MIRAKMRVEAIVSSQYSPNQEPSKKVIFRCAYDPQLPEDQGFCKATPSGVAEFVIDNPEAIKQLIPGKTYYFDISPAD